MKSTQHQRKVGQVLSRRAKEQAKTESGTAMTQSESAQHLLYELDGELTCF